jgi:hypothetical protein
VSKAEDIVLAYYAEERIIVRIVQQGAHFSRIIYTINGIGYDTFVENNELQVLGSVGHEDE